MKIYIFSSDEVTKSVLNKTFPKNAAVISFYDQGARHINYNEMCSNVYYCPFDDIDVWSEYEYEKYGSTFDFADDLACFIYDAYNSGMDIICQCDYGQSRSAGCAAAISQHFYKSGIEIFSDLRRCPNKLIYLKVLNALENYSKSLK